jgi:quercetin dioxygenase-like cupin family protein
VQEDHVSAAAPSGRDDLGRLILLAADEVESLPWKQLGDSPGVSHKVLWRSGDVVLGMFHLEPGAVNPSHVHQGAHHHFLVTAGRARIIDRELEAGSYAYIPPGVAHEVAAAGDDGCTLFYTYRPVEVPPHPAGSPLDDTWGAAG